MAEARAAALGLGEETAWVEGLLISTFSAEATTSRKDALGDLERMIGSAGQDIGLHALLESHLGDLIRKLPHEVRVDADDAVLKAAIDGEIASVIEHAGGYLTARLHAEKR